MGKGYPWYDVVGGNEDLLQGDFIRDCPIVIPPSDILDREIVDVNIAKYNVVVMSQSCDIVQKKIDLVLVCPVWTLTAFGEHNPYFKDSEGKESLKRGYLPGYHLLNKCGLEGFETDYLVVDFRNVYGVPLTFLLDLISKSEKRLRLLPPYREHLSQAFARFFMRVGLPVDIPEFK